MIKELLYKLSYGCTKASLSNKETKVVHQLEHAGILKVSKETIIIPDEYIIGTVSLPQSHNKRRAVGYLVPFKNKEPKDPIIDSHDLKGARNDDFVVAKIAGYQRGRKKAKVVYVLEVSKPNLIGAARNENGKIVIREFFTKNRIPTTSKQKALKTLPKNAVLSVDEKTKEIREVLGVLDDPHIDEQIVLKRYERQEEFPNDAINESKAWGDEVYKELYPDRKDLTHLPFITIDPVTAKDYDDAVYYDKEKNILYVAIADVTEYVREFTALDNEAKKRGFTIYFPHKSIPMLPRVLSENLCSLNEGVDRLVFTFKIHLDSNGKVEKFKLFEGVIRSQRRFTYEEIDTLLETPEKSKEADKKYLDYILPLRDLILLLRSKRLAKGYTFLTPGVKIELDNHLHFKRSVKEEETLSHKLVEECMLLANISAASYFNYGIFRSHPSPDIASLNSLSSDLANVGIFPDNTNDIHRKVQDIQAQADKLDIREVVDKMIIKSLKRAEYTYENIGHFGLGFDRYTHFTSPIRRYSDLILHRFLKAIIKHEKKKEKYIEKTLPFTTKIVTSAEGETSKIMWDYEDFVYCRWADKNKSGVYKGIITDIGDAGKDTIIKLQEEAYGARIFCKFDKRLRAENFDKVAVRIKQPDMLAVRIYGEIVEIF